MRRMTLRPSLRALRKATGNLIRHDDELRHPLLVSVRWCSNSVPSRTAVRAVLRQRRC